MSGGLDMGWLFFDADVEAEDAEDFVDGFGFFGAAMGMGDDEFGLSWIRQGLSW